MAHGLELRTPLVDWRLLQEVAPLLPALRPGEGKRLLATAPSQALPDAVIDRPKTGFSVPVGAWQARLDQPGAARPSAANRSLASRQHARNLIRHFADSPGPTPDISKVQVG
jgi:asparagine synthase (glutamine-hydrolysing)